jgi:hypothetical protein
MPKIYLANPGTEETVTRPVIAGIAKELFDVTGLPPDTKILYPGHTGRTPQAGSTVVGQENTFGNTLLPFAERMYMEVKEDHDPERAFTMAVMDAEHLPVFVDERVETMIRPVYSPQDVTINFTYHALDRTAARRWRDEIRTRVAQQQTQRLHRLNYSWMLPHEFEVILKEIHSLMQAVEPYTPGQTYDQWFALQASQRISSATTMAGTQPVKLVAEKQIRVVGYFDFESFPEEGEKVDGGEAWSISFAYKFHYEKPIGSVMFYPLMVHNQMIKYRPDHQPELVDHHLKSFSNSTYFLRQFEKGVGLNGAASEGISVPPWDEFRPSSAPINTLRMATFLTGVDPEADNPRLLMNLETDTGGDFDVHPRVLRFLKATEYPFLNKPNLSAFHVSLYRNRHLRPYDKITCTADLDVIATEDLSLRDYYHVRFSIHDDWWLMSKAAQQRLRENADIVCLLLQAFSLEDAFPQIVGGQMSKQDIVDALALDSADTTDFGTNYLSRVEFDKAANALTHYRLRMGNEFIIQFNTVMTSVIQAHRRDLLDAGS